MLQQLRYFLQMQKRELRFDEGEFGNHDFVFVQWRELHELFRQLAAHPVFGLLWKRVFNWHLHVIACIELHEKVPPAGLISQIVAQLLQLGTMVLHETNRVKCLVRLLPHLH